MNAKDASIIVLFLGNVMNQHIQGQEILIAEVVPEVCSVQIPV